MTQKSSKPALPSPGVRYAFIAVLFLTLFILWLVLSGHFQLKYIVIGAFAAALVTFLTRDLFYPYLYEGGVRPQNPHAVLLESWRFTAYIPWLLWRILTANLQVAYILLHPRLPIDPVLLTFPTRLPRTIARVILGNSITLTPGTVTVDIEDDRLVVHTLKMSLAGELVSAAMQNKIGGIFLADREPPPKIRQTRTLKGTRP